MLTPAEQTAHQLDWLAHHGVARLDLAVQQQSGAWVTPHQAINEEALIRFLPWCRAENARGSNVYLRSHRHDAVPVAFLDDVTVAAAAVLAEKHPALVIETSPDRCHLWLAVDRPLGERERYRVQSALAHQRVGGGPLADPGSVSGDHYGRLAGFRNRKPTRDCWVNFRLATNSGEPLNTAALVLPTTRTAISTPGGCVEAVRPAHRLGLSPSERDWAQVLSRLERGDDPAAIECDLAASAGPRRGQDAPRYAARTVCRALARVRDQI